MVIEWMEMVPKCWHISSTSGATTLSLISPYDSLFMPTMWNFSWLKTVSGFDCGIPHVDGQTSLYQ